VFDLGLLMKFSFQLTRGGGVDIDGGSTMRMENERTMEGCAKYAYISRSRLIQETFLETTIVPRERLCTI
jgi:hypothetical protein